MPEPIVEIVLDQFAATNERDFRRAMSHYAEDVELEVDADASLEAGTFTGREAVGRWFGEWFSTFEPGYRFDIDEARAAGDVVFLRATHHGRGRTTGLEVYGEMSYLYTVRDEKIVRVELFRTPAAALSALEQRE